VTRAFTHQLVRHRVGFSFSQLSQQYHTETAPRFIIPSAVGRRPAALTAWREAVEKAFRAYCDIVTDLERADTPADASRHERRRLLRSAARTALPAAIESKIAVTANARALRLFLTQRGALEGDEEMRRVCAAVLASLAPDAPALFADFRLEHLADGSPIVRRVET
jgi:thymidylate synthase (FAD)